MESAVHLTSKKRGMVTLTDPAPAAQRPASPAAYAVGLTKTYGTGEATVHALAGVNVTFERGRFTAVMGPSGSGKSTLMHCMAGLDRPTSGQSFVGDLDIGALDDGGLTQMRRDHIGFVFQSFNLVPTLTAGENITLPVDLAGRKVDKEGFDYRDAALPAPFGDGVRAVHRHGDPRPPRGVVRRPGGLPGRRQHRRRPLRADARLRAGADPDPGDLTCGG